MCRLRNIALESVTEKCDRRTDRKTDRQTDDGQSDPYESLCFAGDTKMNRSNSKCYGGEPPDPHSFLAQC